MEIKDLIIKKESFKIIGIISGNDIDDIINMFKIDKDITVIKKDYIFKKETVYEEMKYYLENINYNEGLIDKKIDDALLIVGLSYKKNVKINKLSTGEEFLIQIASKLSLNPKILVIDDIFYYLDKKNREILINLVRMLNSKYKRNIILVSNNIDFIYKYANEFIIIKNKEIFLRGPKEIFFKEYDKLIANNIDIPQIIEFSKIAYVKKNIKLHIRNDIKDLMKDIYRNVK